MVSKNTDLLGVVHPVNQQKSPVPRKMGGPRKKYGINIHFIPKAKNKFKKKRRILARWKRYKVYAETSNRISRLGLRHWYTKEKPWYYAKFDKKLESLRYTNEEYIKCNLTHANWSRKETDTLMELCTKYDLRFHVIQDRFVTSFPCKPGERLKSIPDLKERYYSIQRALLRHRGSKGHMEQFKNAYEKGKDIIRREQLELALSRTKNEHHEMLRLVEANRKNNQALKLKKKEAKERRKKFREQQKFITMRLQAGTVSRSDCVLTTGGIYGYYLGYGVIIKDEWKQEPPPVEGSPLANLPAGAKVHLIPSVDKRRLYSRSWKICQPRNVVVNLPLTNQPTKIMVQSPPPPDPRKEDNTPRHRVPPGYILSTELQKRLEALGFPVTSSSGPFKYPTNVLCQMFDKLRDDLLSLILLEQLVKQKRRRISVEQQGLGV